jgi:hypothetical protein
VEGEGREESEGAKRRRGNRQKAETERQGSTEE